MNEIHLSGLETGKKNSEIHGLQAYVSISFKPSAT